MSDSDGYNYTFVVCGNLSNSHCGNDSVGEFALWYIDVCLFIWHIFEPVTVLTQQLLTLEVNLQEMYTV